jgi:hypothetical protein
VLRTTGRSDLSRRRRRQRQGTRSRPQTGPLRKPKDSLGSATAELIRAERHKFQEAHRRTAGESLHAVRHPVIPTRPVQLGHGHEMAGLAADGSNAISRFRPRRVYRAWIDTAMGERAITIEGRCPQEPGHNG